MTCPTCGVANSVGAKFCVECGTRLQSGCPSCGASNPPGARFCSECGARLGDTTTTARPATAPVPASGPEAPTTERRLVSVLFADLVGFTARSDGRDPEAVREFLSRYFDTAREIVERYGGIVEKFIGDAVMAVWGTPVAQEDDAERAVRAGLDLVDAVRLLGRSTGDDGLELRAGVLTGEAAVAIGVRNQGMVAGDLVNTASRLQSIAPPGCVLVGESTFRASNAAIAFEEAGPQLLKGKTAPVAAWRALRVVAERGGRGRSEFLEAPFVGRDAELRLLKDAYHASARERKARLVSVVGQAGIGKSRLAWEFLKYIDGLLETVRWHQGRSPAYGEGITFWALGEMVRRRAQLAESDDERTTRDRLAETLQQYVPDEAERRSIERGLLVLLGFEEATPGGREQLFAAWRTFFERIAEDAPTVLVFEDLQWADPGLLDFIEHLLDWSRSYPILVVTLSRPELTERRPDWGGGRRSYVSLSLEPLPETAMRELLGGLVPGLPEKAVRSILDRADGIPLYAVETVRMLVAEGRLVEADGAYRPTGDLSALAVPETLHALIAARLDALDPVERAILQDAAVLGQMFPPSALAAVSGQPAEAIDRQLRELVRREILVFDTDPRSPERGQFGFTQALIREVAYGTLARRDRRIRHLAAARYFEAVGEEELAAVLSAHYLAAYEAAPDGPEGDAVAAQARLALRAAAERAVRLGSYEQATTYLRQAMQVTRDPAEIAGVLERLGELASIATRHDEAERDLRDAIERHRALGDRAAAARATAALGSALIVAGHSRRAFELLETAHTEFEDLGEDPAAVALGAQLARAALFTEKHDRSVAIADTILAAAERHDLVAVVADVLVTRGTSLVALGRTYEGVGALETGIRLAESFGLTRIQSRGLVNLGGVRWFLDPRAGLEAARASVELTRRLGHRSMEVTTLGNAVHAAFRTGEWAWALAEIDATANVEWSGIDREGLVIFRSWIDAMRGEDVDAELERIRAAIEPIGDSQASGEVHLALAFAALAARRLTDAIDEARQSAALTAGNGPTPYAVAARAALWLGDRAAAQASLAAHEATGSHGPALDLERRSIRAGIAALEGRRSEAAAQLRDVQRGWLEAGCPWEAAMVALDAAELVGVDDAQSRVAAEDARETFASLGARPFLERIDALLAGSSRGVAAATEGARGA
ncbi:MAG TPA: adenylate/guanylate cyclase domain-containing protein [Candidatus Limnocylindrales bacterium]